MLTLTADSEQRGGNHLHVTKKAPESPAAKKATATPVAAFKAAEKPTDAKKAPASEKTSADLVE